MSREVIIKVRDDLDGSDAVETVQFAVRGVEYEIDLSPANIELFEKSVQQFVEAARLLRPVSISSAPLSKVPVAKRELMARRREIRGWASRNGWPQLAESTKGRVPYDAIEAYQLVHPEVELPPEIAVRRSPKQRPASDLESVTAQQMLALNGVATDAIAAIEDNPQARAARVAQERRRAQFGSRLDQLTKEQRGEIRAWGQANGFEQSGTGLIRTAVLEAYFAAHEETK